MPDDSHSFVSTPQQWLRLLVVVAVAVAFCGLLLIRLPNLNGTPFHLLPYHWIATGRVYPAMLVAAAPAIAAQFVRKRAIAIGLLMLSTLCLQLVAVGIPRDPYDIGRAGDIINSPWSTSYFTDAKLLAERSSVERWMPVFSGITPNLHLHSRQKPPGQILYFLAWLRLFPDTDPLALATNSGIFIAVLATLAVPAVYVMAKLIVGRDAGFLTATYFGLSPGFLLFCPAFDQLFPIATALIIGAWIMALRERERFAWLAAIVVGLTTAVFSFCAYVVLTLGAFCALLMGFRLKQGRMPPLRMIGLAAIVAATVAAFYLVLWLIVGFNPFSTMSTAIANERAIRASMKLPHVWPHTLLYDWQDFFFSSGWMSVPLILMGLWRVKTMREPLLLWLAIAQILIVWSTGIMAPETARLWIYLQPLAMLLIGAELTHWRRWARVSVFLVLAIVTACMTQNILFISDTVY